MKGYEFARDAGAEAVTMVLYASDGMAQKNAGMNMSEAEDITVDILRQAN